MLFKTYVKVAYVFLYVEICKEEIPYINGNKDYYTIKLQEVYYEW